MAVMPGCRSSLAMNRTGFTSEGVVMTKSWPVGSPMPCFTWQPSSRQVRFNPLRPRVSRTIRRVLLYEPPRFSDNNCAGAGGLMKPIAKISANSQAKRFIASPLLNDPSKCRPGHQSAIQTVSITTGQITLVTDADDSQSLEHQSVITIPDSGMFSRGGILIQKMF